MSNIYLQTGHYSRVRGLLAAFSAEENRSTEENRSRNSTFSSGERFSSV